MVTFKSGVVRSGLKPRYDLVNRETLQFIADKMNEFVVNNPDKDPLQYRNGQRDEEFIRDIKNHAHEHFLNYVATGDVDELKGALANLNMLAWIEVNQQAVIDHPKDVDDLIYPQEPAPVVEAEVIRTPEPKVDTTITLADVTVVKPPCTTCGPKTPDILGEPKEEPLSLGKSLLNNFLSSFKHD